MSYLRVLQSAPTTLLALAFFAGAVHAQPSDTDASIKRDSTSEALSGEDAIQLNAFEVISTKDKGYVASESTTGTRVASKIRDLPFIVDVITADFLQDFAAFDRSEE